MTVPAIGLHKIAEQDGLINPSRLVPFVMGAMRILRGGRGGALTFMAPGTPGYQGIVLLNVKIHIGMGLERLFMVFIVGVIVGDMAGLTPVDFVGDFLKVVFTVRRDHRLQNFSGAPEKGIRFVIIHFPFKNRLVADQFGEFFFQIFFLGLEFE